MFRDKETKTKKTLIHYAAELGFLHVTKTLVKKCPGLLALKTKEPYKNKKGLLPVELALVTQNDDVAAYLIRIMSHERYDTTLKIKVMVLIELREKARNCMGEGLK